MRLLRGFLEVAHTGACVFTFSHDILAAGQMRILLTGHAAALLLLLPPWVYLEIKQFQFCEERFIAQMYPNSCVHELSSLFRHCCGAWVSFSLDRAAKRPRLWFPEVTATIVVQM